MASERHNASYKCEPLSIGPPGRYRTRCLKWNVATTVTFMSWLQPTTLVAMKDATLRLGHICRCGDDHADCGLLTHLHRFRNVGRRGKLRWSWMTISLLTTMKCAPSKS